MRNLKKALALVLALMMALSLMSFASASDYADGGKIEKNEAVEVMSMINVFQGTDGGNFDPEGNLTRAQAAKIISYMKLGSAVADALPKDEAPFGDVKADRWYTGYVTYAKAEGIISGRSEQVFDPNGTVTGYEFGKMVLEAAGIKGEYTGTSSWMLNINLALRGNNPGKIDLMTGVNAVLSSPISRENACQLAFNALNYTATGETTGNFIIVADEAGKVPALNGTVCGTRSEAMMLVTLVDKTAAYGTDYTIEAERNNRGSLADVVFSLSKAPGTSTFGAPAQVWTSGDKSVTIADAAAKSYEKTTGATVAKDLKVEDTVKPVIVVDGKTVNSTTADVPNGITANALSYYDGSNAAKSIGGNGSKVDVYKTVDNAVKIVVVNTYVGTIASHTPAKGETRESVTLTLDGAKKPDATTNGVTFNTSNFTAEDKGAVVLYTSKVSSDGTTSAIQSVTVPAEATGTVTRRTATSFTMGGVTYKYSAKFVGTELAAASVGKEASVYLDNNGNVIKLKEAAEAPTNYAVLLDKGTNSTGWSGSTTYKALLLLADGSKVEKTVTELTGTPNFTDSSLTIGKIYTYVPDGETGVKLTLLTNMSGPDYNGLATISEGTIDGSFEMSGNNGITRNKPQLAANVVADKDTVFFITSSDGKTCEKYVGISAVPSVIVATTGTAGSDLAFVDGHDDFQVAVEGGKAKLVYVARAQAVEGPITSSDMIFIANLPGDQVTDETGTYYEYPAVVNGEIKTVKGTVDTLGGKLYRSTTEDSKGLTTGGEFVRVSEEKAISAGDTPKVGIEVSGSNIKVASDYYVYGENTKVFLFDGSEISEIALTAIEADTNDKVWGYTDKDGALAMLFIEKVAPHVHNLSWSMGQSHSDATCEGAGAVEYWTATCSNAAGCDWVAATKYSKEGTATGAAADATVVTKTTIDATGHDFAAGSGADDGKHVCANDSSHKHNAPTAKSECVTGCSVCDGMKASLSD